MKYIPPISTATYVTVLQVPGFDVRILLGEIRPHVTIRHRHRTLCVDRGFVVTHSYKANVVRYLVQCDG